MQDRIINFYFQIKNLLSWRAKQAGFKSSFICFRKVLGMNTRYHLLITTKYKKYMQNVLTRNN